MRIRWTNQEHLIVATEAKKITKEFPMQSDLEAIKTAQKRVLPEERWRDLSTVQVAKATIKLMDQIDLGPTPLPLDAKTRVLSELDDEEAFRRFKHLVLKRVGIQDVLPMFPVEDLLSSIYFPEVAAYVATRQAETLEFIKQRCFDVPPLPALPVTQPQQLPQYTHIRLPRVMIAGCIPKQEVILRKALSQEVELRFSDKDKRFSKSDLPDADLFIVWVDFVPHNVCSAYDKAKTVFHKGGIKEMISTIRRMIYKIQDDHQR